jgi:hypothetical protein
MTAYPNNRVKGIMMSAAVLALLGGWMLFSILAQVPSLQWAIRWFLVRDEFGLIPSWSFFAHPEGGCLYLWYRDTFRNGDVTDWHAVELRNPSLWRTLWNPKKRHWKMLEQACHSLLALEEHECEEQQWLVSPPYLLVVTTVMALPRQNGCDSRQFLLACTSESSPVAQVEQVFLSQKHQW